MSADQFVMLFRLLYGCGLRISEGLNLEKSDIDLQRKIIKIRNRKRKNSENNNSIKWHS